MSQITANLYTAHIPPHEPTPGERWYTEQCERAVEQIKRRMGWGLCAAFPAEAREAE